MIAQVRFELDSETHDPINVAMYEHKATNGMVEEMMLLANMAVASRIHQAYPNCAMLRRHPPPPPANFEPLRKVVEALGFSLQSGSNGELAASLDKIEVPGNEMANKLIRIMATRCMQQARHSRHPRHPRSRIPRCLFGDLSCLSRACLSQASYFSSGDSQAAGDFSHYGLAAPIYTHFTSPIRRYADVVVHRLLSAAIGLTELPESLRDAAGCMRAAATQMAVLSVYGFACLEYPAHRAQVQRTLPTAFTTGTPAHIPNTTHARTHAGTRTRTHARTHTHTHTHTHR